MKIEYMSIDLETFSSIDISRCGIYKYAESPDAELEGIPLFRIMPWQVTCPPAICFCGGTGLAAGSIPSAGRRSWL